LLIVRSNKIILVSIFFLGCAFGLLRFTVQIDEQASTVLDIFAHEQEAISIHGEIMSDPIKYLSYTEMILDVDYLSSNFIEPFPVETRVLVKTDIYSNYEYGQKILVSGKIEKPTSFITDTNRVFDYQAYLAKDQIYYTMSFAEAEILGIGNPSIKRSLFQLKHFFLDRIYRLIPEPESGLLSGILFGEKSGLDDDWEDKFRIVGLMHIVVLSGYNVSLVIQLILKTLTFLPLRIRSLLAIVGIICFALLVGAGPTVIRASVMALFIVLAQMISVKYNITRALSIAGIIMILINPRILYFDISFQLSFLATYGLIVLTPWLSQKFKFLPHMFAIRESAIATIAAQIMVLPILIYHIGEFSLISPIVNILVLFAVPYAMFFGFITALVGPWVSVLGISLGVITTYLLRYQLWIVDLFSRVPFASIEIPKFHWLLVVVMYGVIFWRIGKIKDL
jgi:competence protein ComEC